jgi:hypothetical protein
MVLKNSQTNSPTPLLAERQLETRLFSDLLSQLIVGSQNNNSDQTTFVSNLRKISIVSRSGCAICCPSVSNATRLQEQSFQLSALFLFAVDKELSLPMIM